MESKLLAALFCAVALNWCSSAWAFQECATPAGKFMNLNNGDTTRDFTGSIVCKEKDTGELQREIKYVNGVETWERFYERGKPRNERFINPQGNSHGAARAFWPSGKIKAELNYDSGSQRGLCKHFFEDGKVESIGFYLQNDKRTEFVYNQNGTLASIACSAGSFSAEDRRLCGFSGKPGSVTLYASDGKPFKKLTFDRGELTASNEIADDGKVASTEQYATAKKDGVRVAKFPDGKTKSETRYDSDGLLNGLQREFDESGQQIREAQFKAGFMERELLYYLNGQPKRLTEKSKRGDRVVVRSVAYWDSGRVQREGLFDEVRGQRGFGWGSSWRYGDMVEQGEFRSFYDGGALQAVEHYKDGKLTGVSKYYFEDGKALKQEITYVSGDISRLREFKQDGRLTKDETYFKDGSRKSMLKK